MSFGKRGCVPASRNPAARFEPKHEFIGLSSERTQSAPFYRQWLSTFWPNGRSLGGSLYPLSCLGLGLILGGCAGATLTPQLLQAADDAGIYDFIRMNAGMRAPAPRPAALPWLQLRQAGAAAHVTHVVRAHLPPQRRVAPEVRRFSPAATAAAICASCDVARFGSPREAILNDLTLRAGDTVILSMGAKVFRGARHLPYTLADFADFRASSMLTKTEQRQIDGALGLTRKAEALRAFKNKIRMTQASLDLQGAQIARISLPGSGSQTRTIQ